MQYISAWNPIFCLCIIIKIHSLTSNFSLSSHSPWIALLYQTLVHTIPSPRFQDLWRAQSQSPVNGLSWGPVLTCSPPPPHTWRSNLSDLSWSCPSWALQRTSSYWKQNSKCKENWKVHWKAGGGAWLIVYIMRMRRKRCTALCSCSCLFSSFS